MRLAFWSLVIATLSSGIHASNSEPDCKCGPSDPCWPSLQEWDALNKTVSGRLLKTVPPAVVCYRSREEYNVEKCKKILNEWTTDTFHSGNPFSVHDPTWSWDACPPLYSDGTGISGDPDAESKGCSLGTLSPYVINATTAKHIQSALKFATKKNLRINLKNTGHNPEKSSAYGSLGIWTHNMKDFKFHKSFKSCANAERHMAGTVGAGFQDGELFEAMSKHDAISVGGTNMDVGVAGWSMAGGHGYGSGIYGMGADNIIEAEVVTPQGDLVKVNECENQDLFWAIRGGGGSTFGVIISMTVKAYPMPSVAVVTFDVSPKNGTSPKQWWHTVARVHQEMADLQDLGYAGYYTITGNPMLWHNTVFVYNATGADDARNKTLPLESALKKVDSFVDTEISQLYMPSWYQLIQRLGSLTESTETGKTQSIRASRLITRKAIEDVDLFPRTLENVGPKIFEPKTGVTHPKLSGTMTIGKTPVENALNPVWRDTVVHLISEQRWNDTLPNDIAEKTIDSMVWDKGYALRQLAPDSGAYINEADPYEPNWQWSLFGPNYHRLLSIKEKYDPDSLFWCRNCVGSEQFAQKNNGSLCRAV
ncbi:unnamed protein product [Penicillium salamii]|uniref:FAD-binding PCMH-type domain-containing protein n=1 Tax=Penicillium salamii TaxID=1612424 RepID=A0A9W4JS43_9EURO|nr:unnamed protein product [Penicillium salamii]CAG8408308.1 unnamed protein product [Penicillium salamii]CAG8413015.1 unnamed protein product [Penicillium salamii]